MKEKTQFEKDLEVVMNVNDGVMSRGIWNLIVSIRDMKLFCKGIKIHRHWRMGDVKLYFGVTGGKEKILNQLEKLLEQHKVDN